MAAREVVVLSGARTAIGRFGGSLKDIPPTALASAVAKEAIDRAGIAPEDIQHAVFGNCIHTDKRDFYFARVAAVDAGVAVTAALSDPFDDCHMGQTAENVASEWGISREDQDLYSVESHRRAAAAIKEGIFKEQVLPIQVKGKGGPVAFENDEHVRTLS